MSETLRIEIDPGNPPNLNAPPPPPPAAGRELPPPPRAAQPGPTGSQDDDVRRRQQAETDRMAEIRRASSSRQQVESEYRLRQQREEQLAQQIAQTRSRLVSAGLSDMERQLAEATLAALTEGQALAARATQEQLDALRNLPPTQQMPQAPRAASLPAPIFTAPQQPPRAAVETPQAGKATVNAPEVETPTVPAIKVPSPEITVPTAGRVQIPQPQLLAPQAGAVQTPSPELLAPRTGKVQVPAPELLAPQAGQVRIPAPKVETPTAPAVIIPSPKLEAPQAGTVRIPSPQVETPTIPSVQILAPKISTPTIPPLNIAAPSVRVPAVPPVQIPTPKILPPALQPVQVPTAARMPAPTMPAPRIEAPQAGTVKPTIPETTPPKRGQVPGAAFEPVQTPTKNVLPPLQPVIEKARQDLSPKVADIRPEPPRATGDMAELLRVTKDNAKHQGTTAEQITKLTQAGLQEGSIYTHDSGTHTLLRQMIGLAPQAGAAPVTPPAAQQSVAPPVQPVAQQTPPRPSPVQQPPAVPRTPSGFDPQAEARKRMESEAERKEHERRVDIARRGIDPKYKRERNREVVTERLGMVNQAVGSVGQVASGVGGLAPSAAFDGIRQGVNVAATSLAGIAPVAAGLTLGFSAVVGAASGLVSGLNSTAKVLAPFSASLSVAQANVGVNEIKGNIRRAEQLGPELSSFVETQGQLKESGKDLMADLLKPLIPIATAAMKGIISIVDFVRADLPNFFISLTNIVIDVYNALTKFIPFVKKLEHLEKIEKNTRRDSSNKVIDKMITDMLKDHDTKGERLRSPASTLPWLRMPIMEGL